MPSDIVRATVVRRHGDALSSPNDTLDIENDNFAIREDRRSGEPSAFTTSVASDAVFAALATTGMTALGNVRVNRYRDASYVTVSIECSTGPKVSISAATYRELPPAAVAAFFIIEGAVSDAAWEPDPHALSMCPLHCHAIHRGPEPPGRPPQLHRTQPRPG